MDGSEPLLLKLDAQHIMSCLEQIIVHPPQTTLCLRFISFHGD